MTEPDGDRRLGELFEALAPVERPVDAGFVSRVELRIAELERYRRWRTQRVRALVAELLAAAAIGTSLAFISQAPGAAAALGSQPTLIWTGSLIMLLCWLGATGGKPRLLNLS